MNNRLYNAFDRLALKKQDKENLIPGLLGFMINGVKTVEVQDRPGYVYVRLRNNTNELILAFNDQVSPVYDLPVLVVRDDVDTTRYKISGRDVGKYENWGSVSAYLPRHGNQHSFSPETGGGGDVVWVYDRQLMPLALVPSGTSGSGNVTIAHDTIFQRNIWKSVGGTGTADLLSYKPTGSSARLVLVYLDQNGNPQTTVGSFFNSAITGTAAIVPYLPYPPQTWDIPLGAVRLVSGTSEILWDNIYDLRGLIRDATTTGTTSTGVDVYDSSTFKVAASKIDFGSNLTVAVTGSVAFVDAAAGGGAPTIWTRYSNTADAHTTNNTWENILHMAVSGSVSATAQLLCHFTCRVEPNSNDSELIGLRFILDDTTVGESWWFDYSTAAYVATNRVWLLSVHTVFTGVTGGFHSVKAQWEDEGGNLNVNFYQRRLTVMIGQ